jgi:hypothetical protein
MEWLEKNSEVPGTITVANAGKKYHLPIGRFDNRVDKTSFLRVPKAEWPAEQVKAVRDGIKSATDKLHSLLSAAK